MAMTPWDVLARRTAITLEDRQRGAGIVEEVARLMASEQAWSAGQQQSLTQAYRDAMREQIAAERGSQSTLQLLQ
jgi:glycerol-3-phosphate dehydrogenase